MRVDDVAGNGPSTYCSPRYGMRLPFNSSHEHSNACLRVDDVAGNIWQALPGSASKMVAGSERLSQHAAIQGRAGNFSPALTLTMCSQCTEC
jgi:hypothetical protein